MRGKNSAGSHGRSEGSASSPVQGWPAVFGPGLRQSLGLLLLCSVALAQVSTNVTTTPNLNLPRAIPQKGPTQVRASGGPPSGHSLKGLRGLNLPPGSKIRLIWRGSDLNNQPNQLGLQQGQPDGEFQIEGEQNKGFRAPLGQPLLLPSSDLNHALGLESCGFSPSASPSSAKVAGTQIVLLDPQGKPRARLELKHFAPGFYQRSRLVYADQDVQISGKGVCSAEGPGEIDLNLSLKKGWNWVVFQTRRSAGSQADQHQASTQVRWSPAPVGVFELAPLKQP